MPSGIYIRTDYHKNILKLNGNSGRFRKGSLHRGWKNGISSDKRKFLKYWRHKKGISNAYNNRTGLSQTKEYKRLYRKQYKYRFRQAGELTIKTIQQVYEDNINKFKTLTCYLCLKPIEFGKDNLEHKIPLVRGGINVYDNLAISCGKCNRKKHTKTEAEYRKAVCVL